MLIIIQLSCTLLQQPRHSPSGTTAEFVLTDPLCTSLSPSDSLANDEVIKTVCTNQCNNNINTGLQQDFGPDLCCTGIPRNICWKDWKENPNLRGDVKICMSASGGCVQRNDFPTWGCLLKYCTKSKLNLYFFPFSASLTVYFTTFYPSNFIW